MGWFGRPPDCRHRFRDPREAVTCFDDYVGPGYSLPTPEMAEAVRLLARTEGVLLDPVYTGKAMAGLIDLARKGYFPKGSRYLSSTPAVRRPCTCTRRPVLGKD